MAAFWLILANPAWAAEPSGCPIKFYRFEEDCRNLAGQELTGIDALRLIPLGPHATLTFGGETRLSYEQLTAPIFGLGHVPESKAAGYRALLDADLRMTAGARVFVQLISAEEKGRKPIERPFDHDALDLGQGFLELPADLAGTSALLRVGRQELDLQGNRLVGVRDIANVRLAFDLALVEARPAGFLVDLFGGRPVLLGRGPFDDGSDPHETFSGVAIEHPLLGDPGTNLAGGFFAFRRTRTKAIFFEGAAPEERYTVGARVHGSIGPLDLAVQGALQRGRFGQLDIEASGIAMDIGWRFVELPGQPRLGLSAGRASGDTRKGDGKLGTFDPLYPNLSYFTDASPIYPSNVQDLQPNLTVTAVTGVTLQTGVDLLWRVSNQDAIYIPPGIPLIPGTGHGTDHAASLPFIRATWSPGPHWLFSLSYVAVLAGGAIRQAGGHDANYFRATVSTRF